MKKIYFKKILQYDPTFNKKFTKYDGYEEITTQRLNPSIAPDQKLRIEEGPNIILSSSLQRAKDTLHSLSFQKNYVFTEELNEFKFSLKHLVSEEEFKKEGSKIVRKHFVEAFINDDLTEKRKTTREGVINLLNSLKNLKEDYILCISHSFRMKIIEAFVKTKGRLFFEPELLANYILFEEKTYNFGEGFFIFEDQIDFLL